MPRFRRGSNTCEAVETFKRGRIWDELGPFEPIWALIWNIRQGGTRCNACQRKGGMHGVAREGPEAHG